LDELLKDETTGGEAEFFLATVTEYNSSRGAKIRLDGQDTAMSKYYKITCGAVNAGDRVVVMKHAGTFIVLGAIVGSGSYVVTDPTKIFVMASGFSCNWARYAAWGKIAMVTASFHVVQAVTTGSWTTWATIVAGKRPLSAVVGNLTRTSYCTVESDGAIEVSSTVSADSNYIFTAVYLLP